MAKIKKLEIIRVPVEVEFVTPILGRLYSVYAWFKCMKLLKYTVNYAVFGTSKSKLRKVNHYLLAIPKFEVS